MGRRSGRLGRAWPWLAAGPPFALVGFLMLVTALAGWAEREQYRRAPACAETVTEACLRETGAVVEDTWVRRRRADEHLVRLRLDEPPAARPHAGAVIDLPDPDPVFSALAPGRRVRAFLWGDHVARIEVPGVATVETDDSPLVASLEIALAGFGLMAGGSAAVWFGGSIRRARRAGATTVPLLGRGAWPALGRALVAAAIGAMGGFVVVVALDVYSPTAAVVSVAATTVVAWALLEGAARRRDS